MEKLNRLEIMRMLKNRYPKTYVGLLKHNQKKLIEKSNRIKSSDVE